MGSFPDENYLTLLGVFVLKAEKKFNEAEDFAKKDDLLRTVFLEERLLPNGNVFDVPEEEVDGVRWF